MPTAPQPRIAEEGRRRPSEKAEGRAEKENVSCNQQKAGQPPSKVPSKGR